MIKAFARLKERIKDLVDDQVTGKEFLAVIGKPSGQVISSGSDIFVTDQASGQILTVPNRRIPNQAGRLAWVGKMPGSNMTEVLRFADEFGNTSDLLPIIPDHDHNYSSRNPIWVDSSQIIPFLVIPIGELKVKIFAANIFKSDGSGYVRVAEVAEYDLSSYQPDITDQARYVLIQADDDGSISVIAGETVANRASLTVADIPTPTGFRSHAVILSEGVGVLMRNDSRNDFIDLRFAGGVTASNVSRAQNYQKPVTWVDEFNVVRFLFIGHELLTVETDGSGDIDDGAPLFESAQSKITRVTSSTYSVVNTDRIVFANSDANDVDISLQAGTQDRKLKFVNTGSSGNYVDITPNGSEHLLGENSAFRLFDGESLVVSYDLIDGWY
jgi:hypothetical protein